MTTDTTKQDLHGYLRVARDAMVWKLEGLSEYDARRPLTPTGTNLLGLVKHVAGVEAGYLGECFGRPFPLTLPWQADDAEPNSDLWARAEESQEEIVDLYHRVWRHADETVEALDLRARGSVPWWPEERREVTLGRILVHVLAETNRHAGHADIVRELVDGAVGVRRDRDNMWVPDGGGWESHRARVQQVADSFRRGTVEA